MRKTCGAIFLALLTGCGDEPTLQRVPASAFGAAPVPQQTQPTHQAALAPATTDTAMAARVDTLARNILAANPQIGIQPLILTAGRPQPEVFHRDTSLLGVTEGLVKQCTTDAQLAAILCHELGKMVAEREAHTGPRARDVTLEPPPDVRVGNDSGGYLGTSSDLTRLAELGRYRPPAARPVSEPPPNPEVLARDYLTKAGFAPTELDGVAPLLHAAEANNTVEKQLTGGGTARPWSPPQQ
jgi:hypothetical protein